MSDEPKVWLRRRRCKSSKTTYHLRWVCPTEQRWRSRKVGSDRKRAEREAAVLEWELTQGTHQEIRRIGWADFVTEHVRLIVGGSNAVEARHALDEFSELLNVTDPRGVTFATVESFAELLRANGNATATVNKKLRYLRAAFNRAI